MRSISFAASFALVLCAATPVLAKPNTLTEQELADGWILLFDGETTYGWKAANKADWKVADGAIAVTSGEKGLLHTTTEFANYQLKVDFRSAPGTNSGIFLRTPAAPENPETDCYELNIADAGTNPFPTGSLVGRKVASTPDENDSRAWQTFEVTAEAGRFVVKLDGREILDYTDEQPLGRGYIGLQLNSGKVEFRNIKLKPLGLKSIFNGRDLTGWNDDQTKQSKFTVEEGVLRVKDGPGQLETAGKYGDFVLQLDVFSNGKELNSGVFFRSIPGDFQMGYESQIHNGMVDGDPTKPNNGGTGGIFRRQEARQIVAKDFEWFTKTIIADGPHMAVWVDGIQVSDWTDTREPHENPRKGLRTAAGTIILQGHDPTTDLSFRNFRIGEIPAR